MGIDLLRIVATIFIITLHILTFGRILNNYINGYQAIIWLIYIISFCGVDCYAIISGYVSYDGNYKLVKLFRIWLTIIFYTLSETAIFAFIMPDLITKKNWLNAIFPIITNQYWYMSAYFILFILIPILNKIIKNSSKSLLTIILFILIGIYMSVKSALKISFPFEIISNTILLISLYMLGGFIKKYKIYEDIKNYQALILFILMTAFSYITRLFNCHRFINNDSPTMVLAALGLFLFFHNIKIEQKKFTSLIKFFAPSTMCVYIIHTNRLILDNLIEEITSICLQILPNIKVITITILIIAILIISTAIDKIRLFIFSNVNKNIFKQ